ncbi:hypothetical protein MTP99_016230 [Tenebrio molitor]|jgi:hypothetical protein|nr:hypothetical protein MTP99_016230 [Tenebrio molitor]
MQKGQSEAKRKRRERKPDHVKISSSSRLSPRFAICQDIGPSELVKKRNSSKVRESGNKACEPPVRKRFRDFCASPVIELVVNSSLLFHRKCKRGGQGTRSMNGPRMPKYASIVVDFGPFQFACCSGRKWLIIDCLDPF